MKPLAYYNENDPKAAAWLRELINRGLIVAGDVDERSICDVSPADLDGYTQVHLFAGIGGWSYALRLAGWPDDRAVWTGSCPCQPFSNAGQQRGTADKRHLWPDMRRLITERKPSNLFGEQVASRLGREWLAGVRVDLETLGYEVGAADLCAASAGAPHIRQRLWWVANATTSGRGRTRRPSETRRRPENESGRLREPRRPADANGLELQRIASAGEQSVNEQDAGACGLERSPRDGREQRRAESGGGSAVGGCGDGGLVNPIIARLEGHAGHGDDGNEPGRIGASEVGSTPEASRAGFWSAYDLIPCRDGKARRVEPGSFPLAHGATERVVRLRGYGNAIVPQVAATFITACPGAP